MIYVDVIILSVFRTIYLICVLWYHSQVEDIKLVMLCINNLKLFLLINIVILHISLYVIQVSL